MSVRVRQGFIQRGGGSRIFFPQPEFSPPEIFKLSMVIIVVPSSISYLLDISMCHQMVFEKFVPDCVRSNLRGSKFKNFPGGTCPQTPLVGTCVSDHPATILFLPPTQNPVWNPGGNAEIVSTSSSALVEHSEIAHCFHKWHHGVHRQQLCMECTLFI